MSVDYTPEDWEAWVAENPWDRDIPEITETLGFALFVLDRRTAEFGGEVRRQFEGLVATVERHRLALIRRFWWS